MELNIMTRKELDRLEELEKTIKEDLKGFIRVGMALKEIKEKNLYREKYTTWPAYLKNEWDMGRSYADYQIDASITVKNLEEKCHHGGTFDPKEYSHAFEFTLPKNERQTRPLTLLSQEQQPEAWKQVLFQTGGKVTALAVNKVVHEILELQLKDEKQGIQERIVKEVTVPDDFSDQFSRLVEILDLHRKSGWKEFNRKRALEYLKAIEEYLNS